MRRFLTVLSLAVCFALPIQASAGVTSLEGANIGEHWSGPKFTLEELKGRVVMFELWGYN